MQRMNSQVVLQFLFVWISGIQEPEWPAQFLQGAKNVRFSPWNLYPDVHLIPASHIPTNSLKWDKNEEMEPHKTR